MTIKRIQANQRMSQMVIHGGLIHFSGQIPSMEGGTIEEQTGQVLDKIDALLAEAGSVKRNIISATIWLANMDDFSGMNEIWDRWVDPENPPARACVEARLALPQWKIEIQVLAAKEA